MAETITTIDGKMHVILDERDVKDIVIQYVGEDVLKWIDTEVNEKKEEIEELRREVEFLHNDYDSDLRDIKFSLEDIMEMLQKDKIDKAKILKTVKNLHEQVILSL